jgi:hypothetical protein
LRGPVRITGVDRPGVVGRVQHEAVRVFTKTIKMRLFRQMSLDVDILALEHQFLAGCIKQHFTGVGARNREREWIGIEVELQLRVFGRAPLSETRAWEHFIRDLVDGVVAVLDLDVQSFAGLVFDFQLQIGEVGAVDVASLACKRKVGIEA